MKGLILSVKAGNGHHSTGMAMVNCFNEHGIECEMLDTLEYINKYLGEGIDDAYLRITKHLKEAYGMVYGVLDKKETPYKNYSPEALISKLLSKKLAKFLVEYNPDFIIGTHSYAGLLMSVLKKKGILTCPLYGVITDFTIHPFWESTNLDYYIVADELLTATAARKGIPSNKILPYGIPINEQFSSSADKEEMKRTLGLKDKETVLVMMGSMGYGNITDVVETLDAFDHDYQIVVICGNNEKAKSLIEERFWNKDVYPLGYTKNVHEYMDAADLIITKPGGLTTSEAMAKRLPLILMNPIPGQEDRNQEFLVNAGVAMAVTKTFPLESALFQFFNCPWRRELMKEAVNHVGKPHSTRVLYEFISKNNLKEEILNVQY